MDKRSLITIPVRMMDRIGVPALGGVPVRFITERADWSIKWDGTYIAREVEKIAPATIRLDEQPYFCMNRVVHFGSQFQWVSWYRHMARSNRMVCTFFHGKREDDAGMARHVDDFLESLPRLERVITAATLIENRLLAWGVPRDKLVRIPIGVDTSLFAPVSPEKRKEMRRAAGIPDDRFVIGSFQKDGNGWGEGMEPKFIKGPDILIETIRKLSAHVPVFVLLTGPARGYVKKHLDEMNVPYMHEYVTDYPDLAAKFGLLDAYINPSREEGGPKGILEAMASGVPVVTTRTGMAMDVIHHEQTGFLHDIEDADALAASLARIYHDPGYGDAMVHAARARIMDYDWAHIGRMHYDLVYKQMLQT